MQSHFESVPADLTLQRLVDEHVLGRGIRCFLIKRGDGAVGLTTLHRIKEVPQSQWETTTVAQIMVPLEQLKRIKPEAELWTALEEMAHDGVNQLPVMRDGQIVGMLSRENIITFLGTLHAMER